MQVYKGHINKFLESNPSCVTCARQGKTEKATPGKSYKRLEKGKISHERKLQLFERCPARWTGGVAPQPGFEAFLVKTSDKVSPRFLRTELFTYE